MSGPLSRILDRWMMWVVVVSFLSLFLLSRFGEMVFLGILVGPIVVTAIHSYYREVYQVGQTKVIDPHVLEWKSENPPYFSNGYIGLHDEGEQFAWVCRHCGESAIEGEEETLREVDCEEMEAFEQLDEDEDEITETHASN